MQSQHCGWAVRRSARIACLVVAALAGACQDRREAAAVPTAPIATLVAACVDAMVRSSCRVMNGPTASTAASVVFVAGVGPVDAEAYRQLRASGEAMCSVIESACRTDWDNPQCKTARSLWPGDTAAAPAAASAPR